ncbi:protein-glutamate methylesterase/protein-glutamine glutaminase [Pseudaquabacterium pictum]|uniref:Protein-glutamate methylesterase/protein-glutamine glutaminase n=1 Tax=Pseudaquabacterium pictum TaxID=2315236 RepID=A0A480AQ07_9BURK|nr:chemotaxis response regulator protein-glutamate methylesterase [Rubrivivax pictus]GCL63644.1 chemotaxis response regulator protein-glutamate methylesterase of group 2 operon [Rubrivivax pictus]
MAPQPAPTATAGQRITAVVVDDSAVVRKHLAELLAAGGIEVIATASDPLFAWPKMAARWPDVVVLDVEMPRMDGISFLRKIMAERPTPVVMCSTLTEQGATTTLQALAEGAVAFVTKPKLGLRDFLTDPSNGLVACVRAAAASNLRAMRPRAAASAPAQPLPARLPPPAAAGAMAVTTDRVVAVGSSTGGVQAIETLLVGLPRTAPGMVIVQHMPERFTGALAERLNGLCAVEVKEASDGDRVVDGRVLIAPGGRHMQLLRSGAQYLVSVRDGPLVNRHKPSVDVLFKSVAHCAGANALGIILTGMGDDGARGLREMRDAGARTAAQDEATSVVYGMPREAVRLGGAESVLPLGQLAGWLQQAASRGTPA